MRYAWINEKGGTLKTTLAVHSAVYLSVFRQEKTLLIDMDPQGQAGKTLGLPARMDPPGIRELLLGEAVLKQCITPTERPALDIIRSEKSLADVPEILARTDEPYSRLREALQGRSSWKNIVFDAPPSLSILTSNILAAATDVMLPVNLSFLSLDGAAEIEQTVEAARVDLNNPKINVRRVVPTLYRRTRLAQAVLERLQDHFGKRCLSTRIGVSVKVDEAQSWGKTIWEYAPRSVASVTFLAVMEELYGKPRVDGFAILKRLGR